VLYLQAIAMTKFVLDIPGDIGYDSQQIFEKGQVL
jgi:hypothetical protein